jgi:pyruvate kinase
MRSKRISNEKCVYDLLFRNAENDIQVNSVDIAKASSDAAKLSVSDGSVELSVSEVADNVIASSESELPSQSSSHCEGSKSVVTKIERKKRQSVGTRRANNDDEFENATIHIRKCEKAGCPAKRPVCFVGLSEK